MRRFACSTWLSLVFAWSTSTLAQTAPCPSSPEPWVKVIFSGPAWSNAVRDGVIRELRIELSRRSLQVCQASASDAPPDTAPREVVTLLASDAERVSIVGSNIEQEGGFSGRTILVGSIPDDARALAIAQAVDEALRSGASEAEPPPAPAPAPVVLREAPPPPPPERAPSWFIGAALAPTLQIAPASSGRTRTTVTPGVAARLSLMRRNLGGSLGVAITRASDLSFGNLAVRDFRVPADLSLGLRLARGSLQATLDVGLLAALVNYEYERTGEAHSAVELGGRAGLRFGWGRRVVPWLGASVEVLPHSTRFALTPTGKFGGPPSLWLGFALGTEVNWP